MSKDPGRDRLELLARPSSPSKEGGERTALASPAVGLFTCARTRGEVLVGGQPAGVLSCLGVARTLVVPEGVSGRIVSDAPERVHEPVGHGTTLYELAPLGPGSEDEPGTSVAGEDEVGLAVRAPYSGRFWHRPSPGDSPFFEEGDVLEAGSPLGLVEVMKTFTHLNYEPGGGLPARARVVRLLVEDGEEVADGQPLVEVEPA